MIIIRQLNFKTFYIELVLLLYIWIRSLKCSFSTVIYNVQLQIQSIKMRRDIMPFWACNIADLGSPFWPGMIY